LVWTVSLSSRIIDNLERIALLPKQAIPRTARILLFMEDTIRRKNYGGNKMRKKYIYVKCNRRLTNGKSTPPEGG
jgi:hypothetical protein